MDSAAYDSPEMMDYTSGTVMGTHVTTLKFRVARKDRRAVRQALRPLTYVNVQENRTFRHSTFIICDFATPADQQSELHNIKEMFKTITIARF